MVLDKRTADELMDVEDIDLLGVVDLEQAEDTRLAEMAKKALPGARTVVILALEIFREAVDLASPERTVGELSMHDLFERNLELINGRLDWESYKIVKRLHRYGYRGLALTSSGSPYDFRHIGSVFPYGEAAVLAGMGIKGWHSMLLTPEYGPRVRLAAVVTDAPLPATEKRDIESPCEKCGGACIKICPSGAIHRPEKPGENPVDRFTCSNYLSAAGGCSQCMRICPAGK